MLVHQRVFVDDVDFPIEDVHLHCRSNMAIVHMPNCKWSFSWENHLFKGVYHRHGTSGALQLHLAAWPWQKMATRLPKYCRQRVPYSTRSMKELFPGYARITAKSMSSAQEIPKISNEVVPYSDRWMIRSLFYPLVN